MICGFNIFHSRILAFTKVLSTNSDQTSIKCRDLVCDVEPPPLKNCKDFTMKLEVKYLCPASSSGANFLIHQLPEGLEMRNILAHGIRMQKIPQTSEGNF